MNILKTLFPPCCIACEREGTLLCADCTYTLTLIEQSCLYCDAPSYYGQTCQLCRDEDHIDGHFSCFGYGSVIRASVRALKYDGVETLCAYMGKKIGYALCDHPAIASISSEIVASPILVPVPTHRRKHYFTRGYTQTHGIAHGVQSIVGGSVNTLLKKRRYTRSQVGSGRSGRLSSIQGSFAIKKMSGDLLQNEVSRTILIIDDITTTGATLRETGALLRKHYPTHQIRGVSLARNK